MELTVLGKYGPYGKADGGCTSSYLVKNGDDFIVLDMGSGTLSQLMANVDITKVEHIFISHLHFDHTSDLLPFRYLLEEQSHKVNIYTRLEDSEWYKILFNHPNFNVVNIDENSVIDIGNMQLRFLPMKHTVPCFAIIIKGEKTMCYTGDTLYNDNIDKCFEQSDLVLADCSKPSGCTAPHMTVDDARRLALKYPNTKIIATHQSASYDPADDLKGTGIISAQQGGIYQI